MEAIKDFFQIILTEQLLVPTWEILSILAILSFTMLVRASRTGVLVTYMFTLHLALRFVDAHFGTATLMISITLGVIILFLGLVAGIKDS